MKQSAVEWLSNEFYEKLEVKGDGALFNDLVNQAKEMEEQKKVEFGIEFAEWCCAKNMGVSKFTLYKGELEEFKKLKGL